MEYTTFSFLVIFAPRLILQYSKHESAVVFLVGLFNLLWISR